MDSVECVAKMLKQPAASIWLWDKSYSIQMEHVCHNLALPHPYK